MSILIGSKGIISELQLGSDTWYSPAPSGLRMILGNCPSLFSTALLKSSEFIVTLEGGGERKTEKKPERDIK